MNKTLMLEHHHDNEFITSRSNVHNRNDDTIYNLDIDVLPDDYFLIIFQVHFQSKEKFKEIEQKCYQQNIK